MVSIPGTQCENLTTATYYNTSVTYNDDYVEDELAFSKFTEAAIMSLGVSEHKCQRVSVDQTVNSCEEFLHLVETNSSSKMVETCTADELVFDKKVVESSYPMKFQFLCDKFPLRGIFNSMMFGGMLLGSLIIPPLSDKFGRKRAAVLSIILTWIAGLINANTNSVYIFAFGRILSGVGGISAGIVLSVMMMESTTPSFTNIIQNVTSPVWTVLSLTVPFMAYLIRNHFTLEMALSAPGILGIIPALCMTESTRWLISKGRLEEAKENIRYIAKINGKVHPDEVEIVVEPKKEEGPKPKLTELFKHRILVTRTLSSFFQWFVVTGTFYGLAFGAVKVAGSPYLNTVIVNFIGAPDFLISIYLFDRLGRKWSLALTQTLSGICCLATGFLVAYGEIPQLQVIFVSLGKACASMAFTIVYIYCTEMYPTALRGSVTGLCSTLGRVGGIYALSIDGLRQYWEPLPFMLLGGQAVIAGILALTFPETTGCKLPETIDDALTNVGKEPKFRPWCAWDNKSDEEEEHEMNHNTIKKGQDNHAMTQEEC